jgi:transcriptional regulator with XRE-family HTH domain
MIPQLKRQYAAEVPHTSTIRAVDAADVVTMIQRRSGMTRLELAAAAGFDRTTLSRWEHGEQVPSLDALNRLAGAAGLALSIDVATADDSLSGLVGDQLRMSPQQRLAARLDGRDRADVEAALWWVASRRWRVIVVGAVAGVLHGAPERPRDGVIDLVPESMLRADDVLLGAGAHLVDDPDGRGAVWQLPRSGRVRLIAEPPGTGGYRDLARHAIHVQLHRDHHEPKRLRAADVADLLRIATASADPVDRSRRPGLLAVLEHADETAVAA